MALGWGGGERGAGNTLPLLWRWDKPPADCSFRVFIFFKHPKLFYLLIFLTLPLTSGKLKGNPHPALLWEFLGRAGTGVMLVAVVGVELGEDKAQGEWLG